MSVGINPQWPLCEKCGEKVWKVHREPHASGFEDQAFTCSNCGHVTERTVVIEAEYGERAKAN